MDKETLIADGYNIKNYRLKVFARQASYALMLLDGDETQIALFSIYLDAKFGKDFKLEDSEDGKYLFLIKYDLNHFDISKLFLDEIRSLGVTALISYATFSHASRKDINLLRLNLYSECFIDGIINYDIPNSKLTWSESPLLRRLDVEQEVKPLILKYKSNSEIALIAVKSYLEIIKTQHSWQKRKKGTSNP